MTRPTISMVAASVFALATGCAAKHQAAWEAKEATAGAGDAMGAAALAEKGDSAWALRADRAQLEAAIAAWKEATTQNPNDADTWTKLARGAYFLADGWLAFEEGDAARARYLATHEEGMSYGEKALIARSAEFKRRVQAGEKVEEACAAIDKEGVPALYWYTSNLGKWSNAQGFATVLKNKGRIKTMIERVQSLAPDYFYGAADRYLMVIYSKAPPIAGGDLKKAEVHYQASLKQAPNYLATHVLWAEFYATRAGDRDGYKRELEWVLAQADDVIPELVPEAQIEKKKAKRLLEQIEDKF